MYGKMQGSELVEIISLRYTLNIWDQYPVFHHLEFPTGHTIKGSYSGLWLDGNNICCLLKWQCSLSTSGWPFLSLSFHLLTFNFVLGYSVVYHNYNVVVVSGEQ